MEIDNWKFFFFGYDVKPTFVGRFIREHPILAKAPQAISLGLHRQSPPSRAICAKLGCSPFIKRLYGRFVISYPFFSNAKFFIFTFYLCFHATINSASFSDPDDAPSCTRERFFPVPCNKPPTIANKAFTLRVRHSYTSFSTSATDMRLIIAS
jgi:hypothetical protein